MRSVTLVSLLLLSGCNQSRSGGGGGVAPDAGIGGGTCAACPGGRCYRDQCIPDNGTCATDDECQNDTYCDEGICVPYGLGPRGPHDPSCHGEAFAATDFKPPVQKCRWTAKGGGDSNVVMTPIVVDLDRDGSPEILFTVQSNGHLVAIRGSDCSQIFDRAAGLGYANHLAAADFDGDGFPEIVGIAASFAGLGGFGSKTVVLDRNGNLLASGGSGASPCSGPAIADVDGQGPPEILVDGQVFRWVKGNPNLQVVFAKTATGAGWGNVSLFADMDGDGRPEAVTGLQVYDGRTGADETPSNLKALGTPGAYPAVADFNADGSPDLVVVQSAQGEQKLSVFDYKNNKVIFGPYTVAGGGWGGTPTVGDYDGDSVPDIGFASSDYYYVYALKCAASPKPADCTGTDKGVLWQRKTHDVSSGGTGSSTFDFNGDGIEEVVYRDECFLRVFDGRDGKTVFAQGISSGTCLEYPVVADVDNDGHSDIVVPSDNMQGTSQCRGLPEGQTGQTWTQPTTGVFVLTDPMNRWMPSRPLWTAHTYHITEINDDLSVPATEPANWKSYNNHRKNVQGGPGTPSGQTDYTGAAAETIDNGGNDCAVSERLWAQICNRGVAPAAAGVPGTFYTSDPRVGPAKAACTARTTVPLPSGACEPVYCDWVNPPRSPTNLWFRANDDGAKANLRPECKNGNDLLFLPNWACPEVG